MSDNEYDNLFDDFSNIPSTEWDAILPAPAAVVQPSTGEAPVSQVAHVTEVVAQEARTSPSSQSDNYFGDDDALDSSFLAAIDAIEHAATRPGPSRGARSQLTSHMNSSPIARSGSHSNRGLMCVPIVLHLYILRLTRSLFTASVNSVYNPIIGVLRRIHVSAPTATPQPPRIPDLQARRTPANSSGQALQPLSLS